MLRLYLITPDQQDPAAGVEAALRVLPRGGAAVQLRQRLEARPLLERALRLREICRRYGAPLLVNDRADVALAAGADGVHLPARGFRAVDVRGLGFALVGESVHTPEEAARSDADFCLFGPVFGTPGKIARGLAALSDACRATRLPVLAVGGIDETNAQRAIAAGAHGVACIRAVLGARDPAAAAIRLWRALALSVLLCALLPVRSGGLLSRRADLADELQAAQGMAEVMLEKELQRTSRLRAGLLERADVGGAPRSVRGERRLRAPQTPLLQLLESEARADRKRQRLRAGRASITGESAGIGIECRPS